MVNPRIITVLRRAVRRPYAATADAVLVGRFVQARDQAAFAELVARHGPAVWALCRRLLRYEADAEDVFQATFLVLARRAGQVRKAASVGSWLHGVAVRLARKVRDRRPLDPRRVTRPEPPPDPADRLTWAEVRAALDEELALLPDTLRAPLLLCYLRGLTQDEAAAELGCRPRTVKARVARGRAVLRRRLTRRGVELPAALAGPLLAADLTAAVPRRAVAGLTDAAVNVAGRLPPGSGVTVAAAELARTGVGAMTTTRIAVLAVSAAALMTVGTVFGLGGGATPQPAVPAAAKPAAGDPLPAGAIARIGTTQLRQACQWVYLTDGGKTLVAAEEAGTVRWWDPLTGRQRHELTIDNALFETAAYHPATGMLAVMGLRRPEPGPATAEQAEEWTRRAAPTSAACGWPTSTAPVTTTSGSRRTASGSSARRTANSASGTCGPETNSFGRRPANGSTPLTCRPTARRSPSAGTTFTCGAGRRATSRRSWSASETSARC
jgi:RNA polymerase sigma factor (sigma-70 family)